MSDATIDERGASTDRVSTHEVTSHDQARIDGQPIGSVLFSFTPKADGPKADGPAMINVSHDALPDTAAVECWKQYWSDWLSPVDDTAAS